MKRVRRWVWLIIAQQLNISTVAEGVETKENEQMMAQLSCDYGQGYYYSRPLTTADFKRLFLVPYSEYSADSISNETGQGQGNSG